MLGILGKAADDVLTAAYCCLTFFCRKMTFWYQSKGMQFRIGRQRQQIGINQRVHKINAQISPLFAAQPEDETTTAYNEAQRRLTVLKTVNRFAPAER